MTTKIFDWIALTLVIYGAINCGLIGFFQFDLIAALFGGMGSWLSRIVYGLVGISGLYSLMFYARLDRDVHSNAHFDSM